MTTDQPFWERPLETLNATEWEALCDGCARCCLQKLEDEKDGTVYYTNVVCRHLEQNSCRCSCYNQRNQKVPDCVVVTPELAATASWLPSTCAYRLRAEEQPLPEWHPLISGRPESVHEAGISVQKLAISENHVHPDQLEEHVIDWLD